MSEATLEERVAKLEAQVAVLMRRPAMNGPSSSPETEPTWLAAVREFRDDEGLLTVLEEAMKLREADRKKTRKPKSRKQPRPS